VSRKHERHGSSPWSYAPHSAQQVHESACSLGPLPIVMSSLAAARCSSSTTSFFPSKKLSDEEPSQMMREEREFTKLTQQEQDVRALSCSRLVLHRSFALCCAGSTLIRSSCFALFEHCIARQQQDGDDDISRYHTTPYLGHHTPTHVVDRLCLILRFCERGWELFFFLFFLFDQPREGYSTSTMQPHFQSLIADNHKKNHQQHHHSL